MGYDFYEFSFDTEEQRETLSEDYERREDYDSQNNEEWNHLYD